MDRREFLAKAGLAATWAGIAVRVSACGDDGDGGTQPGGDNDAVGAVTGGGHSHSGAVVTEAELSAGNAVTLTLTGSGHTHTVQLSAQQVMDIADGQTVAVTSSMDAGHTHTVTFN